jgi:hypothetical protein
MASPAPRLRLGDEGNRLRGYLRVTEQTAMPEPGRRPVRLAVAGQADGGAAREPFNLLQALHRHDWSKLNGSTPWDW